MVLVFQVCLFLVLSICEYCLKICTLILFCVLLTFGCIFVCLYCLRLFTLSLLPHSLQCLV